MKRLFTPLVFGLTMGLASTASAQNWPVYGGDTGNSSRSRAPA